METGLETRCRHRAGRRGDCRAFGGGAAAAELPVDLAVLAAEPKAGAFFDALATFY
jgi:hypothetical protein